MSNVIRPNFRPKPPKSPPDHYLAMRALSDAFNEVCSPTCPDEAAAWKNYSDAAENFIAVWRRSYVS